MDKNKVALTPPMGWNSWNCYGMTISQEKVKIQADVLVSGGLNKHGFIYVNIDDGWQGERGGKYNAIQPNEKFPDIKGLCDYVHSLGLKIGIYSTPWCKSYGGLTGGCNHELEDARQWAEWGIDFLKYDWGMNWSMRSSTEPKNLKSNEEYLKAMRNAIDAAGREIVLSLSNSAPLCKGNVWSKYANMWRTTGDIRDTWKSISDIGFSQSGWEKFAGPGHWNDPDMMVLGYVGFEEAGGSHWGEKQHPTHLTCDEQITHMTLWSILSAPLILGCDLTKIDDSLYDILANDEVISVDQDPLGIQGQRVRKDGDSEVWVKPLQNNKKSVALFNRGESIDEIRVYWNDLNLSEKVPVRDLWHHKDLGEISPDNLSIQVNPHGAEMFILG